MKMHFIHLCVRERLIACPFDRYVFIETEKRKTKQNKTRKKKKQNKNKNRETKDYNYHIDERVASEWVSVNNSRETRSLIKSSQLTFCYVCLLNIISLIKSSHLLLCLSVKHNIVDQVNSPFATSNTNVY